MPLWYRFVAILALTAPLCGFSLVPPPAPAVAIDPLFGAEEAVFDDELVGSWDLTNAGPKWSPVTLIFKRASSGFKRYEVVAPWYFGRSVEGRLFELESQRILELSIEIPSYNTGIAMPARHYWSLTREGAKLRVGMLSTHLGLLLRSGSLNTPFIRAAGLSIVAGTNQQARAALATATATLVPPWIRSFERRPAP